MPWIVLLCWHITFRLKRNNLETSVPDRVNHELYLMHFSTTGTLGFVYICVCVQYHNINVAEMCPTYVGGKPHLTISPYVSLGLTGYTLRIYSGFALPRTIGNLNVIIHPKIFSYILCPFGRGICAAKGPTLSPCICGATYNVDDAREAKV